jgi:hypothetical protein
MLPSATIVYDTTALIALTIDITRYTNSSSGLDVEADTMSA